MDYLKILFFIVFIPLFFGCSANNYHVELVNSNQGYKAIRFDKQTGEAWESVSGNWIKIIDENSLPKANYKVYLTMSNDGSWVAIRFEMISGKSWIIDGDKWVEMNE